MVIGDVNRDTIYAIDQTGTKQSVNRSSYMSYLSAGYSLYKQHIGDTIDGGIAAVVGNKIISPDDIEAVVYGRARIVPIE